jgi:hypothetical protein
MASRLEVVALDDHPVRRLLALDLLEPRHGSACYLGDLLGEGGRVVPPRDVVFSDVAVEVGQTDDAAIGHAWILPNLTTRAAS